MLNGSETLKFNYGYWDGRSDINAKRIDRTDIPQGKLFCLPRDKEYQKGYIAGYNTIGLSF